MATILKTQKIEEVWNEQRAFWWSKTPQERLEAARLLNERAIKLYESNPNNPPLPNGRRVLKLSTPIERRRC